MTAGIRVPEDEGEECDWVRDCLERAGAGLIGTQRVCKLKVGIFLGFASDSFDFEFPVLI